MGQSREDCVRETGASAGAILIGYQPLNKGVKIQLLADEPKGNGGRPESPFLLLDAGSCKYSGVLANLIVQLGGEPIGTAASLQLLQRFFPRATHVFNLNNFVIFEQPKATVEVKKKAKVKKTEAKVTEPSLAAEHEKVKREIEQLQLEIAQF